MLFRPSEIELLSGDTPFVIGHDVAGLTVEDFWRFQFSNIWDMQEEIAEFIVAKALGQEKPYNKNGWTLWDINYEGRHIEVKETGFFHSWRTDGKVSQARRFGINRAYTVYKDPESELKRQSDVYVFCLNTGETKEESNPLDLENWRFWVVPTSTIDRLCRDNRTISLGRLRNITGQPEGIGYGELKVAVDEAVREMDG